MATATLPAQQDYQMPQPELGDIVEFHINGVRAAEPVMAIVLSIGRSGRNITLQPLTGGRAFSTVRHIGDPKLRGDKGEELRKFGAWDYSRQARELERLSQAAAALEQELADLRDVVAGLVETKKKRGGAASSQD